MRQSRLPGTAASVNSSLVPHNPEDWHVVLRSHQGVVVRYNRDQRALSVEANNTLGLVNPRRGSSPLLAAQEPLHPRDTSQCPFCKRPLREEGGVGSSSSNHASSSSGGLGNAYGVPLLVDREAPGHLSTDYFHLLSEAHQSAPGFSTSEPSRPGTPVFTEINVNASLDDSAFSEGYYQRFFNEIQLLGRGMSGSVYLCQHILNGNPIGLFACKKIPVGNNSRSLVKALKEITHLESLRHPNIVAIHHVWLETAAPSLGPPVPCLFALMDYAHDGSLDKYIRSRGGLRDPGTDSGNDAEALKRKARMRRHSKSGTVDDARSIHLLNQDEILSLFCDIMSGLAFLHEHNMLHLDIKAENILLHRIDGDESFMPTAMLSDFGSAEARNALNRNQRSGTTGTLDYLAPEAFTTAPDGRPRQHAASLDLWATGLVLHLLMFFRLPYDNIEDVDALTEEIKVYAGFDRHTSLHARRDLPSVFLDMLESLVNVNPITRPSASDVLGRVRQLRGLPSPRSKPRRPTHSPRNTQFTDVSSEALVPRQPSPPRTSIKISSPEKPTIALPAPQQQWALAIVKARATELHVIGILAIRAVLVTVSCGQCRDSTGIKTMNLPVASLVLLLSISAVEVVNNVSLSASCLTSLVLAFLAYVAPRSVFLS